MAQFKFDGSNLYSNGSQIGHVEGNRIYDAHSSQIGSLDDVRKVIDGPGGTILVALWLCLVR